MRSAEFQAKIWAIHEQRSGAGIADIESAFAISKE
jgi:hypothetical protein